jgi:hypothetical protein
MSNIIVLRKDLIRLGACSPGMDVYTRLGGDDTSVTLTPAKIQTLKETGGGFYLWCVKHKLLPSPRKMRASISSLPQDEWGRNVSLSSDGVTDTYTVTDPNSGATLFTLQFATGTNEADVYSAINSMVTGPVPTTIPPPTPTA